MRLVGIIAVFVLGVVAIVEGAALVRISRRLDALARRVEGAAPLAEETTEPARPSLPRVLPRVPPPPVPPADRPPAFTAAPPPSGSEPLATLNTPAGRQQLRAAMDAINEERRQERLAETWTRRDERDQQWQERIIKNVPLSGDEPAKVTAILTQLREGRRQALAEMQAGGRPSDQARETVDNLTDNADKALRALLGDERWRKAREARRERPRDQPPQQQQSGP